jgi:4-amino-4-deoxy-L-arabinose transferase-like glycosyltransferase
LGVAVFLAVALPWFLAVSVEHPEFPRYALWQESLQRFAAGSARRSGHILYYLPVYLAGFFPWSFFLLLAGANRLRRLKELRLDANKPILFLLTWAGVVFVFFTISRSKLPAYFLPAIIPLSILMARAWAEVGAATGAGEEGRCPDWLTAGFAVVIGLGLLLVIAPQAFRFPAVEARLAAKLAPAFVALLKPTILYSGLILVALGIVGRNLASRLRGNALAVSTFVLLALVTPSLLARWWVPLRVHAASSSSRQLAATLQMSPEKNLPIYGYYCFRTGLGFYLRRPVGLVTNDGGEMTSNYVSTRLRELGLRTLDSNPHASSELGAAAGQLLIHGDNLRARVRRLPQPMIIVVRNRDVERLAQAVEQMEPLWSDWQYSIWKISPGVSPRPDI